MATFLHTMVRITDPGRSRGFYEALGFRFSRDMDIVRNGELEATNYFFSMGDQANVLELTYNHDGRTYDLGTASGHIAIGVDDLDGTLAALKDGHGIQPERPPYQVSEGGSRICFVRDPDGSGDKIAAVVGCHIGTAARAERDLAPLRSFGTPLGIELGPMPYTVVNSLLDAAYPAGALNYWKSSFLRELSDDAIEAIVAAFGDCPSPASAFVVENLHGQVTRVPVDATAVPHREHGYNFLITSVWHDAATTEPNIACTREAFAAVRPFTAARRYVNYITDDEEGDDPVREAYGSNYPRLVEVKGAYDPTNLFRLNQKIRPPGVASRT